MKYTVNGGVVKVVTFTRQTSILIILLRVDFKQMESLVVMLSKGLGELAVT